MKHFVARAESEMKPNKLDSSIGMGAQKLVSGAPANSPPPHKLVAIVSMRTQSHCLKSIYCQHLEGKKAPSWLKVSSALQTHYMRRLFTLLSYALLHPDFNCSCCSHFVPWCSSPDTQAIYIQKPSVGMRDLTAECETLNYSQNLA